MKELLEAAGATVIISRTDNTSGIRDGEQFVGGGDRDLSEIAEEANANNVDHFLSIHSNALNTTTNYLLLLYHGYNDQPTIAQSLPMVQSSELCIHEMILPCGGPVNEIGSCSGAAFQWIAGGSAGY